MAFDTTWPNTNSCQAIALLGKKKPTDLLGKMCTGVFGISLRMAGCQPVACFIHTRAVGSFRDTL